MFTTKYRNFIRFIFVLSHAEGLVNDIVGVYLNKLYVLHCTLRGHPSYKALDERHIKMMSHDLEFLKKNNSVIDKQCSRISDAALQIASEVGKPLELCVNSFL